MICGVCGRRNKRVWWVSQVGDADASIVGENISMFFAHGIHEHLALWNFEFGTCRLDEL